MINHYKDLIQQNFHASCHSDCPYFCRSLRGNYLYHGFWAAILILLGRKLQGIWRWLMSCFFPQKGYQRVFFLSEKAGIFGIGLF